MRLWQQFTAKSLMLAGVGMPGGSSVPRAVAHWLSQLTPEVQFNTANWKGNFTIDLDLYEQTTFVRVTKSKFLKI